MDGSPDISGLPPVLQAIFAAAVFVGGIIAGVIGYKKKIEAPEETRPLDYQVLGGAIADRAAVDRLSTVLERIADHLERVADQDASRQGEMIKEIHDQVAALRNRAQR